MTGSIAAAKKQVPENKRGRMRRIAGKTLFPKPGMLAFWICAAGTTGLFLHAANPMPKNPAADGPPPSSVSSEKIEVVEPPKGFVLLLTGNWNGQLQPCGCAEKQLGGIDRRTGITNAIPPRQRLLLDCGPLVEGRSLQDEHKLETFLYSLHHLDYDAITLTGRERNWLEKRDIDPSRCPPVVSCNIPPANSPRVNVSCRFEKTLQAGAQTLDCVVLGLSEPFQPSRTLTSADYLDSLKMLQDTCQEKTLDLRAASPDRFIVLLIGWPNNEEFTKSLRDLRAIDLVVSPGYSDEPELCLDAAGGPARITTSKLGKYIARVEIPPDRVNDPAALTLTRLAVEANMPRDPVIAEIIDEYQFKLMAEDLVANETRLPRRPLSEDNHFVGSESCGRSADCHQDIYQKWRTFQHGTAMATLQKPEVNREFDPECVVCHVIGMMYETGYRSMAKTPHLADVGCEACHGPGYRHEQSPLEEYRGPFMTCEECHAPEHSPNFLKQRDEYFQKINHWTEPRKYWK